MIRSQRCLGGRVCPGRDYAFGSTDIAPSGHLDKSQPYTGMGVGPSRSDRPMRENHPGFPSYAASAALAAGFTPPATLSSASPEVAPSNPQKPSPPYTPPGPPPPPTTPPPP